MARNGGVINRLSEFEQSPLRKRWPRAVFPFFLGADGAHMGEHADRYWSNQIQENIRAGSGFGNRLTKDSALAWLTKKQWTVAEGACLLDGYDPDLGLIPLFDLDVGALLNEAITDITPNMMPGKTHKEAEEAASRSAVHYFSLLGRAAKYVGRAGRFDCLDSLSFPIQTFFSFGLFEYYPNKKHGRHLPCFGIFHDEVAEAEEAGRSYQLVDRMEKPEKEFRQALIDLGIFLTEEDAYSAYEKELIEDCEKNLLTVAGELGESAPPLNGGGEITESIAPWDELPIEQDQFTVNGKDTETNPQPKAIASDDLAIIDGLTVADVRAMLDKSNPRYSKELHAALELWAGFESDSVPDGITPKTEIDARLKDWEVEHNHNFGTNGRKRILTMVNWDKNGNKQKPKRR